MMAGGTKAKFYSFRVPLKVTLNMQNQASITHNEYRKTHFFQVVTAFSFLSSFVTGGSHIQLHDLVGIS